MRRDWTGLYVPEWYHDNSEPNLQPLTSDEYAAQVDGLAFFRGNPEIRCIWEFDPDAGDLLGLSFEPGATLIAGSAYWIVSPFVPGRLVVHSPVALRAGVFNFELSHGILFDSNLYDRLISFVESPDELTKEELLGFRNLLSAIAVRKYDFQIMPYIIESFAKNGAKEGYPFALRGLRALLRLHTMDKTHYLQTGEVRESPDLIDDYEPTFGTRDLDEVAMKQLEDYRDFDGTPTAVTLLQIALLKMVLIRRVSHAQKSFNSQWAAFDEFLFTRTGLFLGTIRHVASLYFAGTLERWIRPQKGSRLNEALAELTNCAWDIYLGGLYQQVLAGAPEASPMLCHFCTRESQLASLLATIRLRALRVRHDGTLRPYLEFDLDPLEAALGSDFDAGMRRANERVELFSKSKRSGDLQPITTAEIDLLLSETERDFRESI